MIDITRRTTSAVFAAVVAFGLGGAWSGGTALAQTLPQYADDSHLGVTSCAGSTCHGATQPWVDTNVLQNEYRTWETQDKHSDAYKVLLNDQSKRIAANLGLPNAHEADLCLDCHADNVPAEKRGRVFQIADGVGCEGCHGGAARWLGPHLAPNIDRQVLRDAGLFPTEDPVQRAKLCLSCHFGIDKKFVTHRIMGAGHPRMSFELDTFTAIEPAHFVIDDDYRRRKQVANGIQTWAVGQALALDMRLDALLDPKTNRDGIFPELVMFDCQACHHPLTDMKWQARPSTGLGPGMVRFDDSNALMLIVMARYTDKALGDTLSAQLKALHTASTKSFQDFEAAAKALKDTSAKLVDAFASVNVDEDTVKGLIGGLLAEANAAEYSDYAGAEQAVYALQAVLSASETMGMGALAQDAKPALDKAFTALAKYDGWDYAGFKAAMGQLAPVIAQ